MTIGASQQIGVENQKILRNIAEDLKTPLLTILNEIQLLQMSTDGDKGKVAIIADAAIRLLDSYIVSTQVQNGQQRLGFEPVSASAIMQDTASYFGKFADLRGCNLRVKVSNRSGLIMANQKVLSAALMSMTYGLVSSINNQASADVTLSVRSTKHGVEVGAISGAVDLSVSSLQQIRSLKGNARQLAPELAQGSSSGIAIADALFDVMSSPLRIIRRQGKTGLFSTFATSQQLALV